MKPATNLQVGQKVFFYHPSNAWEFATVVHISEDHRLGPTATVKGEDGERLDVTIKPSNIHAATPGIECQAPDNLLSLSELHHSVLLNSLKLRFKQDVIYTFLGDLVVAVNPYKITIPWYQPLESSKYLQHSQTPLLPQSLKPHSWSVAHRSYVDMMQRKKSQSIIISGESGSGKTEACKIVLKYLCEMSAQVSVGNHSLKEKAENVNRKVQQSNPLLEAFGNAKTQRNDNSSRFGKFMEVQFDSTGVLVGMKVTPFLLEKSRIVTCGVGERVFHCFYLLVAGGPPHLVKQLRLASVKDFKLLTKGNCPTIKGVDESREFSNVVGAMCDMGFSEHEQQLVWRILAAILHLLNVEFEERRDGRAVLDQSNEIIVAFVANDLLQIQNTQEFIDSLTSSTTNVKGEIVVKNLSKQKAEDQRDNVCKRLYENLFNWLIEKINSATAAVTETGSPRTIGNGLWIGLLDIFGFEDFLTGNSFEQLCINLANESLQRHYSRHIFLHDQEEMKREGVTPQEVAFRDNQLCLDLIQGTRNSIISILDDCTTADFERGSARYSGTGAGVDPNFTFLNRVTAIHRPDYQTVGSKGAKSVLDRNEKEMLTPSDYFYRGRFDDDSFTIRHFAGDVKYKVANFVEKNKDKVTESSKAILCQSTDELLVSVVSIEEGDSLSAASPVSPSGGITSPRKVTSTVATKFRSSLKELLAIIDQSNPNWIRCIRPNHIALPGVFEGKGVLEQLVATGVLETIEQRQRNYPFRLRHEDFIRRFGVIAFGIVKRMSRCSPPDKCKAIFTSANVPGEVGQTRAFLGTESMEKLEHIRREKLTKHVFVTQAALRTVFSRKVTSFFRLLFHTICIQRLFRQSRRLRKAAVAYYQELWRKKEEKMTAIRKEFVALEQQDRSQIQQEEVQYLLAYFREFRRGLAPLVAVVLKLIQGVESQKRTLIENEEMKRRMPWGSQLRDSAEEARHLEAERLERERQEAIAQQQAFIQMSVQDKDALQKEERAERERLIDYHILPMKKRIDKAAARAAIAIEERDKELHRLLRQRDIEIKRLAKERLRTVEEEAATWRNIRGPDGLREDLVHLTSSAGLSPKCAAEHMKTFFEMKSPTKVLSSVSATTCCLGDVRSYEEYAAFWKKEYSKAKEKRQLRCIHRTELTSSGSSYVTAEVRTLLSRKNPVLEIPTPQPVEAKKRIVELQSIEKEHKLRHLKREEERKAAKRKEQENTMRFDDSDEFDEDQVLAKLISH